MIGYFPIPFEDEMLYSIVSRYHVICTNSYENNTIEELFSRKKFDFRMSLNCYLENLEKNLSHFNYISAEKMLYNHTFFNYYSTFLTNTTKAQLQELLLNSNRKISGNEDLKFEYENEYYQFCEKCFEEETKDNVPFWHISHNLPGVTLCLKHNCKLNRSNVLFATNTLKTLSENIEGIIIPTLDKDDEKILRRISEETVFLIDSEKEISDYSTAYIRMLVNKGYMKDYKLDIGLIAKDFGRFYSKKVFGILELDRKKVLEIILQKIKFSHPLDPFYHIIFCVFMDIRVNDIEKQPPNSLYDSISKCKSCELLGYNRKGNFKIYINIDDDVIYSEYNCKCEFRMVVSPFYEEKIRVRSYSHALYSFIINLLFEEDMTITEICEKTQLSRDNIEFILR